MAIRADFDVKDVALISRAGLERIPARAGNGDVVVFRMNALLHGTPSEDPEPMYSSFESRKFQSEMAPSRNALTALDDSWYFDLRRRGREPAPASTQTTVFR